MNNGLNLPFPALILVRLVIFNIYCYIYIMIEQWKNIVNTNYAISNFGNLKFLGFKIEYGNGVTIIENEIIVKPIINVQGYAEYLIRDLNNNKPIYHKNAIPIHRLVATYFVENNNIEHNIVNHIDANKLNNHYLNLEWCDISYNSRHAHNLKLIQYKKGLSNQRTILKKEHIIQINSLIEKGMTYNQIEKHLGFIKGYISLKRTNNRTRLKGLTSKIKPDYMSKRFKNSNIEFVNLVNDYLKQGYKDPEIIQFLKLPKNYIAEMRRAKKFSSFIILPANKHKFIDRNTIELMKLDIMNGINHKEFKLKYKVDRTIFYKLRNNTYNK